MIQLGPVFASTAKFPAEASPGSVADHDRHRPNGGYEDGKQHWEQHSTDFRSPRDPPAKQTNVSGKAA